jgi:hypothetical protein
MDAVSERHMPQWVCKWRHMPQAFANVSNWLQQYGYDMQKRRRRITRKDTGDV